MSELSVGQLRGLTANGNVITVPSGHRLVAPGHVLQVVSVTKTDTFSTTNTSFTDITGLSATITPSSASSKILISCQIFGATPTNNTTYFGLIRDTTDIARSTTATSVNASSFVADIGATQGYNQSIEFLDSPSTTSATVYKVAMRQNSGGTGFINRRSFDNGFGAISTITLMEIAQ
jgi:hypothetical protein